MAIANATDKSTPALSLEYEMGISDNNNDQLDAHCLKVIYRFLELTFLVEGVARAKELMSVVEMALIVLDQR